MTSSSLRLTLAAAVATALASLSLSTAFNSFQWMTYVLGTLVTVTGTLVLARRRGLPPALQPLLALAALTAYVTYSFGDGHGLLRLVPGPDALESLTAHVREGFRDIEQLGAPVPVRRGLLLLTVAGVGAVAVAVDTLSVLLRRAPVAGLPLLALFAVPAAVVPDGVGALAFAAGAAGFLGLLLAEGHDRMGRWGVPLARSRPVPRSEPVAPVAAGVAPVAAGVAPVAAGIAPVAAGIAPAAGGSAERAASLAETAPLSRVGRRIGAAALGIAVVVPALLPGLEAGLFDGSGSGFGEGKGSRSTTTYNPIARLKGDLDRQDPQSLLTVRTDDPTPDYLRMTVLDLFDGETWSQSQLRAPKSQRVSEGLPPPDGLGNDTRTQNYTTTVQVENLRVKWLPTPYPPVEVTVNGDWRLDRASRTIFSTRTDTKETEYSVVSSEVTPDPAALDTVLAPTDPDFTRFADLESSLPDEVVNLISGTTTDEPTPYRKVLALQELLTSGAYEYSEQAPAGNGISDLTNFLTVSRTGYCEQFASAMAVMVRELGLPARVAIGFTAGTLQDDGSYLVTTAEAHAWPEVYFEGTGWLRFEPTPQSGATGGQETVSLPDYTRPLPDLPTGPGGPGVEEPGGGTEGPTAGLPGGVGGPADREEQRLQRVEAARAAADASADEGAADAPAPESGSLLPWLLAGLTLGLVFLGPALLHGVSRRLRWSRARGDVALAHAAWLQVRDDAVDLGHEWRSSETPRAAAARLADRLDPTAQGALARIARAEERARYAPVVPSTAGLASDARAVRSGLLKQVSSERRWRARVFPTSILRWMAHSVGSRTADLLDRLDDAGAAVGSRLRLRWSRPAG